MKKRIVKAYHPAHIYQPSAMSGNAGDTPRILFVNDIDDETVRLEHVRDNIFRLLHVCQCRNNRPFDLLTSDLGTNFGCFSVGSGLRVGDRFIADGISRCGKDSLFRCRCRGVVLVEIL